MAIHLKKRLYKWLIASIYMYLKTFLLESKNCP